jgi:fructose-specific PTS system IIA-like component
MTIAEGAKKRKTWLGMCGEMAGRRENLPLMVGLGLDEISAAPGDAPVLKAALASMDSKRCRGVLEKAAACATPGEVRALLRDAAHDPSAPILDPEAILVGSDAETKEEAIREAVDALYIAGRTERPRAVEEAAWAREATYSTGLGYGFAIPHCKTDAVAAPSLALVKLQSPVEWGSTDGKPVSVVILLAVPAAAAPEAHLKVFATLARRLMHEEFRDRLTNAADRAAVEQALRAELAVH